MHIEEAVREARKIAERHDKTAQQLIEISKVAIRWQTPPFSATGFQRQVHWLLHQLLLNPALKKTFVLEQFSHALIDSLEKPPCNATISNPLLNDGDLLFCHEPTGHDEGDNPTLHSALLLGEFTVGARHSVKPRALSQVTLTW